MRVEIEFGWGTYYVRAMNGCILLEAPYQTRDKQAALDKKRELEQKYGVDNDYLNMTGSRSNYTSS